ncbi:MAG: hypothetical protein ABI451_07935 [Dokdonella sp.]
MSSPEPGIGDGVDAAAARWSDLVMICGKCMRRQLRTDLRRELRRMLSSRGKRDFSIIECGCLTVCSTHGITVARGSDLGGDPSRLHVFHCDDGVAALCDWVLSDQSLDRIAPRRSGE